MPLMSKSVHPFLSRDSRVAIRLWSVKNFHRGRGGGDKGATLSVVTEVAQVRILVFPACTFNLYLFEIHSMVLLFCFQ